MAVGGLEVSYDYTVILPLPPHGKQSIRTGNGFAYTAPKTKKWMSDAAMIFAAALPSHVLEGPYRVDILSVKERPQSLRFRYKDGRAKHPEGLIWCPQKPDMDNVRKSVMDSLSRHLTDDKAVVLGTTIKVYSEIDGMPRVVVRIRPVDVDPVEVDLR